MATSEHAHALIDLTDICVRIASIDGRDRAAEDLLCRIIAPRIRTYGQRHLDSDAEVDDLVQEVLLRVLDLLRSGATKDVRAIGSFVIGVSRNVLRERRRSAQRKREILGDCPEGARVTPPLPMFDLVRLAACVDRLPAWDWDVIRRSYCDEESAVAIARALDLTEGNVRVIRHRAISQLRAWLGSSVSAPDSAPEHRHRAPRCEPA
jgi:RNA polymerase sigma-70 factor, ECF subfamily